MSRSLYLVDVTMSSVKQAQWILLSDAHWYLPDICLELWWNAILFVAKSIYLFIYLFAYSVIYSICFFLHLCICLFSYLFNLFFLHLFICFFLYLYIKFCFVFLRFGEVLVKSYIFSCHNHPFLILLPSR